MSSASIPAGYKSKAAFRLVGYANTDLAYPVALGTPTPDTLGAFDLLSFLKENVEANQGWQADETLLGNSGFAEHHNISRIPSGSIELSGRYCGLNQLLAACMGFEKVRTSAALEGPYFNARYNGDDALAGTVTATGTDASHLGDTGATFPTTVVGEFVRLEKLGTNGDIYSQVRRITARPSTTQITISPDWTDNPVATTPYSIANCFSHQYEFSKNMHRELVSDCGITPWATAARFVRWGTLCIDKGVSVHEWQGVYVESLAFKLNKEGLTITAELKPFWIDRRTTGRNYDEKATWAFHAMTTYPVTSRIQFADCAFRLGAQTTGSLDNDDNLGISEMEFSIKNNLDADLQTLASGLYREEPARGNKREVSGSFTIPRYRADTRLNNFTAGDLLMAQLHCGGPEIYTGASHTAMSLDCYFRALKLEKASVPTDGPGMFAEKYNFKCLQPPTDSFGGSCTPTTGAENSELIIETLDSCPFNYFMGQDDSAY
ncbi:hypothetical protein M0R72_10870 [Candidatus Pacearchaeota archaeon]|jgi:hypothetical protein|nr:hypothetical protein [Candidatus Pacearchaeota archaeon]